MRLGTQAARQAAFQALPLPHSDAVEPIQLAECGCEQFCLHNLPSSPVVLAAVGMEEGDIAELGLLLVPGEGVGCQKQNEAECPSSR